MGRETTPVDVEELMMIKSRYEYVLAMARESR